MNPAILINAFNRPQSLQRLLTCIRRANYPSGGSVPLIISIDRSENGIHPGVASIAEAFSWEFGEKRILFQEKRLGVAGHFYACGDLTREFEAIVYLEDDLIVSPVFYSFASQALEYFSTEPQIAGICLFALAFNGYTQYPFVPLLEDSDVFFLQVPYYLGQAFTYSQWKPYRDWLASGNAAIRRDDPIHEMYQHFAPDEWFPNRVKYLVETGRTAVFPRSSVVTGSGESGTHFKSTSYALQTPLQSFQKTFSFKPLHDALSVYDSFYEILPNRLERLADVFKGFAFDVDLNGTKSPSHLHAEYVLTSRPCNGKPLYSFPLLYWPVEANVFEEFAGNPGEAAGPIVFCRTDALDWSRFAALALKSSQQDYYTRGRKSGIKTLARLALGRLFRKMRG